MSTVMDSDAGAGIGRLLEPGRIGSLSLRHRIIMPALATCLAAPDGGVTDALVRYYRRRAEGGASLIITEVTNVHFTGAIPCVLNIHDDRFIEGQRRLAEGIKAGGAFAFCQLYHPGRQTMSRITGHPLVAPSAIGTRPINEVPPEASAELVEALIEGYVSGAVRAKAAGFDGVEVHGAHGYLISAFLSPAANRRTDAYGGDTIRRSRFATEVIRRIRLKLGPDFPITFRLSVEDGLPGGIDLAEGVAISRLAEAAGADAVSVSSGCYDAFDRVIQPMYVPQACNAQLAAAVRQAVDVPVIVAGRINSAALGEDILAKGSADFIAMGRALLADPDLPTKVLLGQAEEVRQCLACNTCVDRVFGAKPIRCILNPEVGREGEFATAPAAQKKHVVVVGGGPAGMQAAAILAQRGHKVELLEREQALGGKIPLCAAPEWKQNFRHLGTELGRQVAKQGVHVETGTTATSRLLSSRSPDAIVVACGAEPLRVDISGLPSRAVVMAEEVLAGRAQVGEKVLVVGGSHTACEVALHLARLGHRVTLARRGGRVGKELKQTDRWTLLPELERRGVRMLAGVSYERAEAGAVIISRGGVAETTPVDTVVLAAGYRPRREVVEDLAGVAPEVYLVGDCVEPRSLLEALHEAAEVAIRI